MPNLTSPVRSYQRALEYRREIQTAIPGGTGGTGGVPCMTYYLGPGLAQQDILDAANDPEHRVIGVKYYPHGATTNSAHGVSDYRQVREQLRALESTSGINILPLMIHAEDPTHPDIFTREQRFLTDQDHGQLRPIMEEFGALRITLEHISSSAAAQVLSDDWQITKSGRLAATITPHHLKYTTSDIFMDGTGMGCVGLGIRPHMFCCPILKSKDDLDALQELAIGGHSNIFLGTDCAPHTDADKQTLGRPGVFNIHSALSDVVEVFANNNHLDRLEGFTSLNGCEWYNKPVPYHQRTRIYSVKLLGHRPMVPKSVLVGGVQGMPITPMQAGKRLPYKVVAVNS
jgi:dihydroorotase